MASLERKRERSEGNLIFCRKAGSARQSCGSESRPAAQASAALLQVLWELRSTAGASFGFGAGCAIRDRQGGSKAKASSWRSTKGCLSLTEVNQRRRVAVAGNGKSDCHVSTAVSPLSWLTLSKLTRTISQ